MSDQEGHARPPRTAAEWASLLVSAAVLLVVAGLIMSQIPGHDDPAAPVPRVKGVRQVREAFHVDVVVRNEGDETASNVQVSASLTVGERESAPGDQMVDFLSGGEQQELTFIFTEDPASGQLRVAVTGYAEP